MILKDDVALAERKAKIKVVESVSECSSSKDADLTSLK